MLKVENSIGLSVETTKITAKDGIKIFINSPVICHSLPKTKIHISGAYNVNIIVGKIITIVK